MRRRLQKWWTWRQRVRELAREEEELHCAWWAAHDEYTDLCVIYRDRPADGHEHIRRTAEKSTELHKEMCRVRERHARLLRAGWR